MDAEQALGAKIRITRLKLGMSQAAFADAFGFALRALQDWEQGRAEPPPAICHYLRVIDREPDAVKRALLSRSRSRRRRLDVAGRLTMIGASPTCGMAAGA